MVICFTCGELEEDPKVMTEYIFEVCKGRDLKVNADKIIVIRGEKMVCEVITDGRQLDIFLECKYL